ncbi:hypothetical protein [Kitasatospora camelliae]|uniref:Uncharacterized protein n=1 Tax=Kitasatospora camelliae TaxID=3156397 RepID=A0AAU8K448_9ACTN
MLILGTWSLAGAPNEGVPAGLGDACARVGRDLLRTVPDRVPRQVRWILGEESRGEVRALVLWWTAEEPRFWRGVDVTLPSARLTCLVAELVQDHLTGYEFVQWPECPATRT